MTTTDHPHPTAAFLLDLAGAAADAPGWADLDERRAHEEHATAPVWQRHAEAGPEVAEVSELRIPADGHHLRARAYRPAHPDPSHGPALHLHLHGGGWWHGSVDQWIVDVQCRERAVLGDSLVVSLQYRKAPEHPFPAAVDDVITTLRWLLDQRESLGVSNHLTVSGNSAGANIAVGALLRAAADVRRPLDGLIIDHLVLEAFPAELRPDAPDFWRGGDGSGIDRADLATCVGWYLGRAGDGADPADPAVSPLAAADAELASLPPTTILIGDRDPMGAGATAFAARLGAAGVPVQLHEFAGFAHHTSALTRTVPDARRWRSIVGAAIADGGPS